MGKQEVLQSALAQVRAFQKVEAEKKAKRMANRPEFLTPEVTPAANGARQLKKRSQARNVTTARPWNAAEFERGGY